MKLLGVSLIFTDDVKHVVEVRFQGRLLCSRAVCKFSQSSNDGAVLASSTQSVARVRTGPRGVQAGILVRRFAVFFCVGPFLERHSLPVKISFVVSNLSPEVSIGRGSLWSSVFTLVASAMGAGCLSLPHMLKKSGLVLGLLLLIIGAILVRFASSCDAGVPHNGGRKDFRVETDSPNLPMTHLVNPLCLAASSELPYTAYTLAGDVERWERRDKARRIKKHRVASMCVSARPCGHGYRDG